MDANVYQERALGTSKYANKETSYLAGVLGAASEAGEMAGKLEKRLRLNLTTYPKTPADKLKVVKEMGDVLWFIAVAAEAIGWDLGDVMWANLRKLEDREERGQIHGDGDDR